MPEQRKGCNTALRADLVNRPRVLASQPEKRQNNLAEEVIQDLLKKYEKKAKDGRRRT